MEKARRCDGAKIFAKIVGIFDFESISQAVLRRRASVTSYDDRKGLLYLVRTGQFLIKQ